MNAMASQNGSNRPARGLSNNPNAIQPSSTSGQTNRNLEREALYHILDWLDIDSLCAFSRTCTMIQQFSKVYFANIYPSLAIDIGDPDESIPLHFDCFGDVVQHLQLTDASLDDFTFAAVNVNRNLRELSFNRTIDDKDEDHIRKDHIDSIKNILETVKTVCATNCIFEKGVVEYLLINCKRIDGFGFTARKDITYRFQFKKVPTLKSLEIVFEAKANAMELLQLLSEKKRLRLNELVLAFSVGHANSMDQVFNLLDTMHQKGIYKDLHLKFDKNSLFADHIHRLATVNGLVGIACTYRIDGDNYNPLLQFSMLYNIKVLSVNLLSVPTSQLAQQLLQLTELKVIGTTIEVISSFAEYAPKLEHFRIKHIHGNRMINTNALNNKREQLKNIENGTTKLNIYVSEKNYIKMKWSSIAMRCELVEIKREESYVPKKRL